MRNLLRCFALVTGLLSINVGWATDFLVTRTDGNGGGGAWPVVSQEGSFWRALQDANAAGAGPHTIKFASSLAGKTISSFNGSAPAPGYAITNSNITIDGEGQNITIKYDQTWAKFLQISGDKITIKDVNLSMDHDNQPIITADGNEITLSNVNISRGSINFNGSSGTIDKLTVSNGRVIIASDQNNFTDCDFTTTNTFASAVEVNGQFNTFTKSTFKTGATAIGGISFENDNNTLDECTCFSSIWIGRVSPSVINVNNNTIKNSDIKGSLEIIGNENKVLNTTITDNLVFGNFSIGGKGTTLKNEARKCTIGIAGAASESRVVIIGESSILDSLTITGKGVIVSDGNKNTISNSTISIVQNPRIENSNLAGVLSTSGLEVISSANENRIYNNKITGSITIDNDENLVNGINVFTGSSNNSISNNSIQSFWNGVEITQSENNSIDSNYVKLSKNHGIIANKGSNGNTISYNRTTENGFSGIDANDNSNNNIITHNITWKNKFNGLAAENGSTNNTFSDNTSFDNVEGINLWIAPGNKINNNIIGLDTLGNPAGNSGSGIIVSKGSNNTEIGVTKGNTIVSNAISGITINESSSNTIVNNLFGDINKTNSALQNIGPAISLQNGATLNIIGQPGKGNTVKNRTGNGAVIFVTGETTVQNTIQGNILSCNAGKGIELDSDGNQNYASSTAPNWVTINTAEFRDDIISGKVQTSSGNITIDIYIAGDCETRCSANQDGSINANELAQGKTWVKSISVAGSAGKWEYTFTDDDKAAGLTKDNAIVTATDGSGNTSEFSVCEFDPPCTLITAAPVKADNDKTSICEGDGTITLNVSTTPTNSENKYEWYKLNETTNKFEIVEGANSTSYTISDKAQNGKYTAFVYHKERDICRRNGDDTLTVAINTNPTNPELSGDAPAFCKGTAEEKISVKNIDGISYEWTPKSTIVSGNGTNEVTIDFSNATNPTIYKIKATNDATGCSSEETSISIAINDLPKPEVDGNDVPGCKATGIEYSIKNAQSTSTYTWEIDPTTQASLPSGNTGEEITVDFENIITKTEFVLTTTEVDANGCTGKSDFDITTCGLKADFINDSEGKICIGTSLVNNEITFTNASKGENIEKYSWNFGTDATPATSIEEGPNKVKYSSAGTKKVQLIIEDNIGNKDTASYDIIVNDLPTKIEFTNTDPTYCDGTGKETLSVKKTQGISYDWSGSVVESYDDNEGFVDLSTATNPTKVFVTATDNETKCQTKDSLSITISANPTPKITGESNPLCEAKGISYSVVDANENSTYKWTLPDGASVATNNENSSSITVDFGEDNGNIIVEETNADGCKGTSPDPIEITLKSCGLKAKFTDDGEGKICINTSVRNNEITFTDQSTGDNIQSWDWKFGTDATPATIVGQGPHKVKYTSTGTKKVQLIITDDQGTKDTSSYEVTVNNIPATLELSKTEPKFCKESVGNEKFSVTSVQGITYDWTPKENIVSGGTTNEVTMDLSSASSPINIKVVAIDEETGCAVNDSVDAIINETPNPKVSGDDKPLCESKGIAYEVVNANESSTYEWTLPDGASIATSNNNKSSITVDFGDQDGKIIVKEINDNGCEGDNKDADGKYFEITLKSCGLKAEFSTNLGKDACIESSIDKNVVVFTDKSSFNDNVSDMTWEWDFGADAKPGSIDGQGPHDVSYSSIGDKTAQLILTDGIGTRDTFTYEFTVHDIPNSDDFNLEGTKEGGCEGESGIFKVTGNNGVNLGAYTYDWSVSDDYTALNERTIDVDFTASGTASVTIANNKECNIKLSDSYNVTKQPNVNLQIAGTFDLCDGYSQHSGFNNREKTTFILKSGKDTIKSLSDIHPQIDSVEIKWSIKDSDGNVFDFTDQGGSFLGFDNTIQASITRPGFILGNDDDGNEILFKDYTINVSIEKKGACGAKSSNSKPFIINKSRKYEFSILDNKDKVCEQDSIFLEAGLLIDGKDPSIDTSDVKKFTDYTSAFNQYNDYNFIYNWYHIDNNSKTSPIKDTVYKAVQKKLVGDATEPAVHYYSVSGKYPMVVPNGTKKYDIDTMGVMIPEAFEVTDTIYQFWNILTTQDTLFQIVEKVPQIGKDADTSYIISAKNLTDEYFIQDTILKSKNSQYFTAYRGDSVTLLVDHDHLCYRDESVFHAGIGKLAVDRPGGIIAMGTGDGEPSKGDTTDLIIKDVEDIKLKNVQEYDADEPTNTWYWGVVQGNDTTFSSENILNAINEGNDVATHTPEPIESIIYKLVTTKISNGKAVCADSSYANLTNLLYPFIPSAITPNNDGQFDALTIHNSANYPEMVVKIFNRWGNLVFTSEKGYPEPWAGTRDNGDELPDGTYFYVVEFNDEKIDNLIKEFKDENPYATSRGENSLQAGSVTILR